MRREHSRLRTQFFVSVPFTKKKKEKKRKKEKEKEKKRKRKRTKGWVGS